MHLEGAQPTVLPRYEALHLGPEVFFLGRQDEEGRHVVAEHLYFHAPSSIRVKFLLNRGHGQERERVEEIRECAGLRRGRGRGRGRVGLGAGVPKWKIYSRHMSTF